MTKRSHELIATLCSMAPDHSASEIAKALGVSLRTAIRWADDEAVMLMTHSQACKRAWADPDVRAKMSAARKRAWADPDVRAKMSAASKHIDVQIPKWAPSELWNEYLDIAALYGEEAAAHRVRALKHGRAV